MSEEEKKNQNQRPDPRREKGRKKGPLNERHRIGENKKERERSDKRGGRLKPYTDGDDGGDKDSGDDDNNE